MTKTNGQIAYEAFNREHPTSGIAWVDMNVNYRAAWEAAAAALRDCAPGNCCIQIVEYERLLMVERNGLKALDRVRVLEAQREALLNCLVVA